MSASPEQRYLCHTTRMLASRPAVSFQTFLHKPSQSDFWRMRGLQHCCTLPRARVEFAPSAGRCELGDLRDSPHFRCRLEAEL